jgi:hypothetical protein
MKLAHRCETIPGCRLDMTVVRDVLTVDCSTSVISTSTATNSVVRATRLVDQPNVFIGVRTNEALISLNVFLVFLRSASSVSHDSC